MNGRPEIPSVSSKAVAVWGVERRCYCRRCRGRVAKRARLGLISVRWH